MLINSLIAGLIFLSGILLYLLYSFEKIRHEFKELETKSLSFETFKIYENRQEDRYTEIMKSLTEIKTTNEFILNRNERTHNEKN